MSMSCEQNRKLEFNLYIWILNAFFEIQLYIHAISVDKQIYKFKVALCKLLEGLKRSKAWIILFAVEKLFLKYFCNYFLNFELEFRMFLLSQKSGWYYSSLKTTMEILFIPTGMNAFFNGRKGTKTLENIMEALN